uniref:Ovule protein n=1 Tax=Haemonchus placei TaxID=6290 RepID=A0A0N4WJJ8_HAEPC
LKYQENTGCRYALCPSSGGRPSMLSRQKRLPKSWSTRMFLLNLRYLHHSTLQRASYRRIIRQRLWKNGLCLNSTKTCSHETDWWLLLS